MNVFSSPKPALSPRISINKLGEYTEASPARRRSIVKSQMQPPGPGITARYGPAQSVLREYFDYQDPARLWDGIERLRAGTARTSWAQQDRLLSIDALVDFADLVETLDLGNYTVAPPPRDSDPGLLVQGLRVSVRPDFLVMSRDKAGAIVGGIKISFNKQHAMHETGCEHVASLLARYLDHAYVDAVVDLKRCFSIATATKVAVTAPRAYRSKLQNADACCEEIVARWLSMAAREN